MRVSQSVATSNAKKKMTQVRNYPKMTKTKTVMTMTMRMTDTVLSRKQARSSEERVGS